MEQLGPDMRADFLFRTIAFNAYCHKVWYTWKLELTRLKYSIWWWNFFCQPHIWMLLQKLVFFLYLIFWNLLHPMDLKFWVLVLRHPDFVEFCSKVLKWFKSCVSATSVFTIQSYLDMWSKVELCAILKNSDKGGANLPWYSMWGYAITSIWKGILVSD